MVGGAVTGSLSMAFGATLRAPHGGVFVVPLMGNPLGFLVAVVAGTVVATAFVVTVRTFARRRPATPAAADTVTSSATERETVTA